MTDKQLLEQALEALKRLTHLAEHEGWERLDKEYAVITAIRARLEQPEQEPVATLIDHYGFTDGVVRFDGVENMEQLPIGTKFYIAPPVAPVQNGGVGGCAMCGAAYEDQVIKAPVQEPVAYVVTTEVHGQMCSFIHRIDLTKLLPDGAKLYTTPPNVATPLTSQRPVPEERKWVGLTDEDYNTNMFSITSLGACEITTIKSIAKDVEAKLKEKNSD